MLTTQMDPNGRVEPGEIAPPVDELNPMEIRKRVRTRRKGYRRRRMMIGFMILVGLMMAFFIGWYIWQDAFY